MIITINQVCLHQNKKCENYDASTTSTTNTRKEATTRKTKSTPSAYGEITEALWDKSRLSAGTIYEMKDSGMIYVPSK